MMSSLTAWKTSLTDFDEADLKPLTVTSVTYSGIGDATAIKTPRRSPANMK